MSSAANPAPRDSVPASIGVAAALGAEARLFARTGIASATGPASVPLALVHTGVGAERARAGAQALVDAGAAALVSFGFAAGLVSGLAAGTLLLPLRVAGHAGVAHATDDGLRATLAARLSAFVIADGMLAETRVPLWDVADKRALRASSGGTAADMESVAIAEVARRAHLPFAAVRAILDGVDTFIPRCARSALDAGGGVQPGALALGLARRPWEIGALVRLAFEFAQARRALAAAAAALHAVAEARA
jgi:nucleoside phosphorylase